MRIQYIFVSYLLILLTTFTHATVYEDGTSSISTWSVYDNSPANAKISSVYDTDRASDVIKLEGNGTKNGYMLGHWSGNGAWNNTNETTLKWSMKFSEDFSVYVSVQTAKGHRYIYYTPTDIDRGLHSKGRYIHHGLGKRSKNGSWQTFSRDLVADLKRYESDNEIITISAILIRGSGLLDDIELDQSAVPPVTHEVLDADMAYYTVEQYFKGGEEGEYETYIYKNYMSSNGIIRKIKVKKVAGHTTDGNSIGGDVYEGHDTITINNMTYVLVSTVAYTALPWTQVMLFRTDGTEKGTKLLKSFNSAKYSRLTVKFTNYKNGKLYIAESQSVSTYGEPHATLWEIDGTVITRVKRLAIGN